MNPLACLTTTLIITLRCLKPNTSIKHPVMWPLYIVSTFLTRDLISLAKTAAFFAVIHFLEPGISLGHWKTMRNFLVESYKHN